MRLGSVLLALTAGCAYMGRSRDLDPARLDDQAGWIAVRSVQFVPQESESDCGVAVATMILNHWQLGASPEIVRQGLHPSEEGIQAGTLRTFLVSCGLDAYLIHGTAHDLEHELSNGRPVIVGLRKPYVQGWLAHYEVVVGFNPLRREIATLDPARGWRVHPFEGFLEEWRASDYLTIVVLRNETSAGFRKSLWGSYDPCLCARFRKCVRRRVSLPEVPRTHLRNRALGGDS